MQFAVHYNPRLATLYCEGEVSFDYFKCPAWPDLIAESRATGPTYVHFPLVVGHPDGVVWDTERKAPVDWSFMLPILEQTSTPYLNLHVLPFIEWYQHMAPATIDHVHIEIMMDNVIQGVEDAIAQVGADRVILENVHGDLSMQAAFSASFLNQLIRETGTGFLLDVSHARLAAGELNLKPEVYLSRLPLRHIREIHITGIQTFEGDWLEKARTLDPVVAERYAGKPLDHLSMTESDWAFLDWVIEQIKQEKWGEPWMMAFEYGGVGGFWELIVDEAIYRQQIPRFMEKLAHLQPVE